MIVLVQSSFHTTWASLFEMELETNSLDLNGYELELEDIKRTRMYMKCTNDIKVLWLPSAGTEVFVDTYKMWILLAYIRFSKYAECSDREVAKNDDFYQECIWCTYYIPKYQKELFSMQYLLRRQLSKSRSKLKGKYR